jgi:antitoxin component of RelBE/YafQ-DinJ toxin-antitoxin module
MTTATAQLNIRTTPQLKLQAQRIATNKGIKLNALLNHFLRKFVENPDVVKIQQEIEMEEIFDEGIREYVNSPEGKRQLRKIDVLLKEQGLI